MPNNNIDPYIRIQQRLKGRSENTPYETIQKYLNTVETVLNPESNMYLLNSINQRNAMLYENGVVPELPPSENITEKDRTRYENIRQQISSNLPITNIDRLATDFNALDANTQSNIINSIDKEDIFRTYNAVNDLFNSNIKNIDFSNKKNKDIIKSILSEYKERLGRDFTREDALKSTYQTVSLPVLSENTSPSHLNTVKNADKIAGIDKDKLKDLAIDFAIGFGIGMIFAPAAIARTGMTLARYISLLVASEATLTGASDKIFEEYGWKGLAVVMPAAIILAPEVIYGGFKFAARQIPKIVAKDQYTGKDIIALSTKGIKGYKDKLYDTTQIGFKLSDDAADAISEKFGQDVASMIESRSVQAENTALSVIESTKDEYDLLKLPTKTRFKPLLDEEGTSRINELSFKAKDNLRLSLDINSSKVSTKQLIEEEFFNRSIQSGAPLIDPRIYREATNLVYQSRISNGVKNINETMVYYRFNDLLRRLPGTAGEERDNILNEIIDNINNGVTNLNNYTNKIISDTDFTKSIDEFINIQKNKGLIRKVVDTVLWNSHAFNPFYNTELDRYLRKNLGFISSQSKIVSNQLTALKETIIKGLSKKDKQVLTDLVNISTDLGRHFTSIEDVAKFDEALSRRVGENVFRAYKETRRVLNFVGNRFAENYVKELNKHGIKIARLEGRKTYKLVKPLKKEAEEGYVKVLDMDGKEMNLLKSQIEDPTPDVMLLRGYFPRIPKGEYNITILNSNGRKLTERRGFETARQAGIFATALEKDLPSGSQVSIHHFSKSPFGRGSKQRLLAEIDEYSDIKEIDDIIDKFKATGVDEAGIKKFTEALEDEDVVKLKNLIDLNNVLKETPYRLRQRIFRPFKKYDPEELQKYRETISEYIGERLNYEEAMDKYIHAFTQNISIDKIKSDLTKQFIRKFGHVLQKDEFGYINWKYFDEDALRGVHTSVAVTAKHIQNQLKRIYRFPSDLEKRVNGWVTALKEMKYRDLEKSEYNPNITRHLLLSSNSAVKFNNLITSSLGSMILFFNPFYIPLQASQSIMTLLANPDVAVEAASKSLVGATKAMVRTIPGFRNLKVLQDADLDTLTKSGLFEYVEIENALTEFKITRASSKPMVWGEKAQRLVAGHAALARARELGLQGDDLYRYVYDTATKYALDMSNFSKRTISEGFFKWNIGLFSRYFTQIAELFWKGLPVDKQIATALTLYELYGIDGIPFLGDAKNLYSNNYSSLVGTATLVTNLLNNFEKQALDRDPRELIDLVYTETPEVVKRGLVARLKSDTEYYKSVLKDAEKELLVDRLEDSKNVLDVFNRLFFKQGILSTWAGRLAYNDFITQKLRWETFTSPLIFLDLAKNTGQLAGHTMMNAFYTTFGWKAPDEQRTAAFRELINSIRQEIATLSPNLYNMVQSAMTATYVIDPEAWNNVEWLAGQDYIATSKGTILKRMEDASIEDVLRLGLGTGYRKLYAFQEKQYETKQILTSLYKQARKEADEVFDLMRLGEFKEADRRSLLYTYRNKVFYGDPIASRIYHNSYLNHLSRLAEEFREPLADQMTDSKIEEVNMYFEDLTGISISSIFLEE